MKWLLPLLVLAGGGCGRASPSQATSGVVLETGGAEGIELAGARFSPADAVVSVERSGSRLLARIDPARARGALVATIDGACPVELRAEPGEVTRVRVEPWIAALDVPVDAGFDAPYELTLAPGCATARAGTVAWRQTAGATARDVVVGAGGWTLRARTPRFEGEPGWGVVPLSPRTRGETEWEATWTGEGHAPVSRPVRVAAASRSHGLTNVAVDAAVWLGGAGWRVLERPAGATAEVAPHGSLASLRPDASGAWRLEDGAHRALTLRAGRFDETPLDCARAECHASLAAAAASSPMATVLRRGLDGALGDYALACAVACHAAGEPGTRDGGFAHTARSLGVDLSHPGGWNALPSALRRLGGVGCTACHGPAALPPPGERWATLRADLCAFCHDAPPRYGHVSAWASSAMARSDRDDRARTEPACAHCHTTAGFLEACGEARREVATAPPLGIACAACHAVHDGHAGARPRPLLRRAPAAEPFASSRAAAVEPTAICVPCHSPAGITVAPGASAAALWMGRGGLDPASGAPLDGPAPHADVSRGCLGCHREGPRELERGAGHAFRATRDGCVECHASPLGDGAVATRARQLEAMLVARGALASAAPAGRPAHASGRAVDTSTPLGRATYDVLLVLEDRGAAAHNLPYARLLLDRAQAALDRLGP